MNDGGGQSRLVAFPRAILSSFCLENPGFMASFRELIIVYTRGSQTFFIKSQVINILGFADHMIYVTTHQLYHYSTKPA